MPIRPTETSAAEPHAVVVANSAIIVFREGLEAVRAGWFEVVPTWETLGAQLLAAELVVGSYVSPST